MSGSVSRSNSGGGGEKEKEKEKEKEDVEQQLEMFSTGQRVEVSSNEEGFKGAWFVGTVVESNRKSKTKLLVEYETLLAEDRKRPLKEYITIPFIRPEPPPVVPPPHHNSSSSFQINDLVDAFHRDAWWAGVITRVLDDYQFVVSFQNPSEDITFSGSSLRFHLEWREGQWIRPQFQMEGQKVGALDTEKVKPIRGIRRAKKSKVRKSGASATGGKKSNARRGGSKEIIGIDKGTRELQDENPTEVHPHHHQQQLVASEIEIGKENDGASGVVDNKKRKRGRPLLYRPTGQSIQKKERRRTPPMNSPSTIQSNEKRKRGRPAVKSSPSIAQSNEVRKRGRPPLKRPINLVERTKAYVKDSSDASTGGASHSKANNKVNDDEMPSSDVFRGLPTLSAEEGISSQTIMHDLRVSPGLCIINQQNGGTQNGYEIVIARDEEEFVDQSWPFDKCSPLWKTIDSMQVFKKAPQKPHFSSLSKCEEQFREGLAIGCMVTFASTVDRISKLQISDPTSVIDRYLETLAELEYHGFNVEPFRACLKELLAKKVRERQLQEEIKQVVGEIAERRLEKTRLENEISEIEAKITEHQQRHGATTLNEELMDQEIVRLQSNKDQIGEDITSVRLNFQKIVDSPL